MATGKTYIRNIAAYIVSIVVICGLLLGIIYFNHAFDDHYFVILVSVGIITLPVLFLILYDNHNYKIYVICLLLLCSAFYNSLYILYSTDFTVLPQDDPLFHWQVVDMIFRNSHIPFGEGINDISSTAYVYSYFPSMHVILAILSSVLGISTMQTERFSTLIFIISPIFVYIISYLFFKSHKVSSVASLVFIFSPGNYPQPSYRLYGLLFLLLFALTYILYLQRKRPQYLLLSIIAILVIGMTHHVALYVALGFTILLFILNKVRLPFINSRGTDIPLSYSLLLMIIGSFWPLFIISIGGIIIFLRQFGFLTTLNTLFSQMAPYIIYVGSGYSSVEIYFDLIMMSSIALLAFLGFMRYRKNECDRLFIGLNIYFSAMFIFMYGVSAVNSTWANLARRFWSLLLIGFTPLIGYALYKQRPNNPTSSRKIEVIGIFIILGFAIASVDMLKPFFDYNYERNTGGAIDFRNYEGMIYQSVYWHYTHSNPIFYAIGDIPIKKFGTSLNMKIKLNTDLYINQSDSRGQIMSLQKKNRYIKFLFVDHVMSIYHEPKEVRGYMEKASEEYLVRLRSLYPFDCIYDNSMVQIIRI